VTPQSIVYRTPLLNLKPSHSAADGRDRRKGAHPALPGEQVDDPRARGADHETTMGGAATIA
jgi:hypothetical protein